MEEEAKLSKILTKDLQEKKHLVVIFKYIKTCTLYILCLVIIYKKEREREI